LPTRRKQRESLRALRDAQASAAAEAALRTGHVSAEEIETLDRLTRLVALEELRRPTLRARLPVIVVTALTLVAVSVLLFARVRSTEIELDVEASRVSFVLPVRHTLTDVVAVSRLGIGGLREASVPRALKSEPQVLRSEDGDVAIQLSPLTAGDRPGRVNLDRVILPAGTAVSVSHAGTLRQHRVEVSGAAPDLHVSVFGPIEVSGSGVGRRTLDFDVPQDMLLHAGKAGLFLDLALPDGAHSSLARQLPIRQLSLQAIDETTEADRTLVRRVSTILGGTLYLEALDGQQRPLRAGEMIQFERSTGEFRSVRLADDRLVLNFRGTVEGMTVGRGGNQISLMPT